MGLALDIYMAGRSEFYWLRLGSHDPIFLFYILCSLAAYLTAQLFLWSRFLLSPRRLTGDQTVKSRNQ